MADNVNAGSNDGLGPNFAADEIGGVKFPRSKLIIGADGVNDGDVSAANPLPVTGTVAVTNAGLTALNGAISGTEVQVDVVGALPAGANNIGDVDVATIAGSADAANSTTATLTSGSVFTGTSFDTLNYPTAVIIVKASHASATDGLSFQWSPDGTNWDVQSNSSVAADEGRGFHVSHRGRYFRIVYTNGGTNQTSFRLNTIHRPSSVGLVTRPLDNTIDDDNYASITRSILAAKKVSDGTYVNITANANGRLLVTNDAVLADDAAFTVGSSSVAVAGGMAVAHGANPDAADAGDAGAILLNRHRIPFGIGGHPNQKSATYLWTGATTDDNVLATIAGGTKYAITRITITLDEATTVGVACRLGFGTASVPALPAANGDAVDDILFYHPGMVPGSMHTVGDGSSILGVGGDGSELRITAEATTSGTGVVTVSYFAIES